MKTKLAAIILAVLLVISFTACASSAVREHSPAPSPSPSPGATADLDYVAAFAKFDPDTTTMTVNGVAVPWSEYFYWLYSVLSSYTSSYGGVSDFNATYDGTNTIQQSVSDAVMGQIKTYNVLYTQAQTQGLALSDTDQQALDAQWKSDVQSFASQNASAAPTAGLSDDQAFAQQEQEFTDYLSANFLPKDLYGKLNMISSLYNLMMTNMFGENASKVSDADTLSWADGQGYIAAKHILFLTVDTSTGAALDAAAVAQAKQKAEDTLATLQATPTGQLAAKFDELMAKSEDPGLQSYPDGYCFNDNSGFDQAFTTAAKGLEVGQITTSLVQSSSGYHIIMRVAVTPDMVPIISSSSGSNNTSTLRELTAQSQMSDLMKGWEDAAAITTEPDFQNLDLNALFGLSPVAATDAATASPAA
ncbi:MAG: peptidylprolyl isomerase [Firmicutes bacterium]|nr:peptidylprolyl isomerase [Bacillota bacterium]